LLDDALKLTNYKDAQLYMLRAYCWEKQKMLSLAMEEYTKAIMLNKADAKVIFSLQALSENIMLSKEIGVLSTRFV